MQRRTFLKLSVATAASAVLPRRAGASVPRPYDWDANPPTADPAAFIAWMQENRGEHPTYLRPRYDRFRNMVRNGDLWDGRNVRAFLLTPREDFCLPHSRPRIYDVDYHPIGFGVTITGPRVVARMTSAIDVRFGEKVLEVGTGSGYQAAYLANLTNRVWSVEIIKPLAERTRTAYDALIQRGYSEYRSISTRQGDGYFGWEEAAPFDKIIVTCGIDHVPPPLLQQLQPGGVMVVPVGPPGAQHILKIVKQVSADGRVAIRRTDVYNGRPVPFVAFTRLQGDAIKGTHDQQ
jgi:protein-L-isoaspartate(D-aspartate) O-methyltransferase